MMTCTALRQIFLEIREAKPFTDCSFVRPGETVSFGVAQGARVAPFSSKKRPGAARFYYPFFGYDSL